MDTPHTTHTVDELPDLLLRYRTDKRVSLRALGRRLKLSPMCLSELERGVKKPLRLTRKVVEDFLRSEGYVAKKRKAA